MFSKNLISVPICINEKFSTIEYLVLNHSCTIRELISLLYHTPNLRFLICDELDGDNDILQKNIPLSLPNLIHLSFLRCTAEFNTLELFLKNISSHLRILKLRTMEMMEYLDLHRWRRLIKRHLPHLVEFHFTYEAFDYDTNYLASIFQSINRFTSKFWIGRQCLFECW